MSRRFPMTLFLGTLAIALASVALPAPAAAQEGLHAEATLAFRAGRFAAAYGRFARAADGGHAPSARAALMMLENGPALFGSDWYASPDQQRRWNALAANPGREPCPRDGSTLGLDAGAARTGRRITWSPGEPHGPLLAGRAIAP